MNRGRHGRVADPTRREIQARAQAIKDSWTDKERGRRFVGEGVRHWLPPEISPEVSDMIECQGD